MTGSLASYADTLTAVGFCLGAYCTVEYHNTAIGSRTGAGKIRMCSAGEASQKRKFPTNVPLVNYSQSGCSTGLLDPQCTVLVALVS